jgi:hypothetical protein
MWLRPLTGKKLRRFFHWKHSGVLIPLFIGMGGIMLGVGVSMPSAEALIFNLAYVFFALASIWTLGFWLTSDALRALDPHTWSKQRKRGRNTARERIFYRIWQWVGCAACLLFLFLSIAFTHFTWNKKDLSQMGGILVPANDPDPIGGQCTIGEDEVGLYLGNYSAKTARFPVTAVQVGGKPLVVLDRNQDGSIALSVDVLSDDGRVIVRIDKNGFTVNPNNYLAVKRLDRSSLVITDQYGMEVLNARFVNKKAFQLSARLRSSGVTVDLAAQPINRICFAVPNTETASKVILAF